eukprot:gene5381-10763_t
MLLRSSIELAVHAARRDIDHMNDLSDNEDSLRVSVYSACGPGHVRASQTGYCPNFLRLVTESPSKKPTSMLSINTTT